MYLKPLEEFQHSTTKPNKTIYAAAANHSQSSKKKVGQDHTENYRLILR